MLQASRLTVVFGPLVLISVISALLGLPLTALIAAQGLSGEILTKMFGMTFGAIALGLALVYVGLLAFWMRREGFFMSAFVRCAGVLLYCVILCPHPVCALHVFSRTEPPLP